MVAATYDTRPREERDYREIYGDLDETQRLGVVVVEQPPAETAPPAPLPLARPVFVRRERKAPVSRMSKALIEHGFRASRGAGPVRSHYLRQNWPSDNHSSDALEKKEADGETQKVVAKQPLKNTFDFDKKGLSRRQVRYDLDEQDEQFLNWRNGRLTARINLSREALELAITVLEEEWHRLEVRMGGMGGDLDEDEAELDESFDKYGNDDGIAGAASILEQRCAVCNDLEGHNGNAIVFCDGCNIAVHQECYGIAFIPEGQWFCRRCMLVRGHSECSFCPSRLGAFKQLDNGLWSHVVCALWIPEVYFANPIYMEPIEGVGAVPKTRWKLVCYICKQRVGACIQCTNRLCFQAYHVTCAKRAGLYMAMEKGVHGALALKATLTSYCHRHCPPEWSAEAVVVGIAKTRRFYRDRLLASEEKHRLASRRRHENSLSALRWKTEHNTPIAPKCFAQMIYDLLLALKVDIPENSLLRGLGNASDIPRLEVLADMHRASAELCKYWCLKREAKRGPLVRPSAHKLMLVAQAAQLYDSAAAQEALASLHEKIEFGHTLVGDLAKVTEMALLTQRRQQLALERLLLGLSAYDAAYFPLCTLAAKHLALMSEKLDPTRALTNYKPREGPSFADVLRKTRRFEYTTVEEISADVAALVDVRAGGALGRAAAKWLAYWQSHRGELEAAAAVDMSKIPFVEVNGEELRLKEHDAGAVLAEEGLSEVEDVTEEPANKTALKAFLKA